MSVTAFNLAEPVIVEIETRTAEEEGDIVETVKAMTKLLNSGVAMNRLRR